MRKHVVHASLGLAGLLGLLLVWWAGVAAFGQPDGLSARFSPSATFTSPRGTPISSASTNPIRIRLRLTQM